MVGFAVSAFAQISTPGQPAIELLAEVPPAQKKVTKPNSPELKLPPNPSDDQIMSVADSLRERLLASPDRLGFGANTTGGSKPVIVRSWEELVSAASASGNYVIIAPDAPMPMIANKSLSVNEPDITIDGSLVPDGAVIEISRSQESSFTVIANGGNFILHNMKFIPEFQEMDAAVLRIRRGENYWLDHVEVEGQFKDDALSLGQRNSGADQATNITVSNYRVTNTNKGLLVTGLVHTDRTLYYTVHKSYLNAKARNPRSNAAVGHIFNSFISSGPFGGGGTGIASILSGTAADGVFRGVIVSESNVFALGNNNGGNPDRTIFTCTAGSDVGTMLQLSDGASNGFIIDDGSSLYSGYEDHTDAETYQGCSENFNNPKASFDIPYKYEKMPASKVLEYVQDNAGVK